MKAYHLFNDFDISTSMGAVYNRVCDYVTGLKTQTLQVLALTTTMHLITVRTLKVLLINLK